MDIIFDTQSHWICVKIYHLALFDVFDIWLYQPPKVPRSVGNPDVNVRTYSLNNVCPGVRRFNIFMGVTRIKYQGVAWNMWCNIHITYYIYIHTYCIHIYIYVYMYTCQLYMEISCNMWSLGLSEKRDKSQNHVRWLMDIRHFVAGQPLLATYIWRDVWVQPSGISLDS